MRDRIKQVFEAFKEQIKNKSDLNKQSLIDLKVRFLGKQGELTALLKGLKDVPSDQKSEIGKELNVVRNQMESEIDVALKELSEKELIARLESEKLDVSLSKRELGIGSNHLLSRVINEISEVFLNLGFQMADGPEIETDYYNFTALNIPFDHPARDRQDSFYIDEHKMLRTQTSTVQVHTMETQKPPIRVICPGKVYRPDYDATHSPMFQQIEGLVIDKGITLCDLKGILDEFARGFFSESSKTRFRPSYFPFTEPSVEVDVSCAICGGKGCSLCKGTGWIEVLGAGVVNPNVLRMSGIDPDEYTGFAFGVGVERAAMLKYGIPDMRILFENDMRFLKQYK